MQHPLSLLAALKYIHQEEGLKGFFAGTGARTFTEVSRSCLKGPFQIYAYDQNKKYFDNIFAILKIFQYGYSEH